MLKIVYIFERRHIYNYDDRMFEFNVFREKGIEIEAWSAVNWTFTNVDLKVPQNAEKENFAYYIDNEVMLKEQLARIKSACEHCFFIVYPYHAYSKVSYKIRKNIRNFGFEFCNMTESPACGNLDVPNRRRLFDILFKEAKRTARMIINVFAGIIPLSNAKNYREEAYRQLISFWGPIIYRSKYNFILMPVEIYMFPNMYESYSNKNILIHSESYDEYLDSKNEKRIIQDKYVVYIDDYMIGHSDFKKNGEKLPITDARKYLEDMRCFFVQIEKKYGCKVVIAAHPKSEYKGDEFGNEREIIYGKTRDLIRDAELVIVEVSTCLNLIALYNKSFINIFSKEMLINTPAFNSAYDSIHSAFKCRKLDISEKKQVERFGEYVCSYNKVLYDEFIENLIISRNSVGKNQLIYETVSDYLLKSEN